MIPNRVVGWLHGLAALLAAIGFVLPLWWVVVTSFRPLGLPPATNLEWFPNPSGWVNFVKIFELIPLATQFKNSLLVEGFAVPLTVLSASLAGFAIALAGPGLQRRLVILSVLLMLVPSTALWLTRFLLFKNLGLIDTYSALIIPAVAGTSPFYVLLFYWTFRRIPKEVLEAARLEGANLWILWLRIAMPLAVPTIVTVAILAFSFYWSDLTSPLLYLKTEAKYTLPVGLEALQQMDRSNWGLLMAAALIMIVPVLLLFLVLQRFWGFGGQLFQDWAAAKDDPPKPNTSQNKVY